MVRARLFIIAFAAAALLAASSARAVTLYTEDFESGAGTFALNTNDLGSTTSGSNQFVVNNVYAGGSGTLVCLGFPFSFSVPNTPVQPGGASNYLHTVSSAASASGINNANLLGADGICTFSENLFARMDVDVNTTGYDNVQLDFLWAFGGGSAIHGEVYYSLNSGTSWNQITDPVSQYKGQTSWTNQTLALDVFNNQPTLRFGFRVVNGVSSSSSDPGFSLDDVRISGDVLASEVPEPGTLVLMGVPLALLWLRRSSRRANQAQ